MHDITLLFLQKTLAMFQIHPIALPEIYFLFIYYIQGEGRVNGKLSALMKLLERKQ